MSNYDFGKIERELKNVSFHLTGSDQKLQTGVYRLCLKYMQNLKRCGYDTFLETHPKLAIKHVLKRISTKDSIIV